MVYTCTTPNGVWCKTNAFFLGKEGLAGTRDRGILWEKRDSQGLAGTGTRVTLAITQAGCGVRRTGTGTRDAFFLGGRRDPQSAAIVAFYGKTGHAGGLGGKVAWHSPKPDGTRDCRKSKAADVVLLCLDV